MKFKNHKYICVDFDGTLCVDRFPEIGAPKKEVIEYIRWQKSRGCKIILHTCRENLPERQYLAEAMLFCEKEGIAIDYINTNPEVRFSGKISRKPYADCYIDDKAMNVKELEAEGER